MELGELIAPHLGRERDLHVLVLSAADDYTFTQELCRELQGAGMEVTLKGSAEQWMSFEWANALKQCDVLLVVASLELLQSSAAYQLVMKALQGGQCITSIMLDADAFDEVPAV